MILALLLLSACAQKPAPSAVEAHPEREAAYAADTERLARVVQEADQFLARERRDLAATKVEEGKMIAARLLAAPHPTLAAMTVVSDLDHVYGRMLFTNRHLGWARITFQQDAARWRNWSPQTAETEKRRRVANEWMLKCDRALEEEQNRPVKR